MIGALVALCILLVAFATPLSKAPPVVDYPGAQWAPADSSNYTVSDREEDGLRIRWIVIHDIEGTEASCINWFQDPAAEASSHYVVGYDGTVYQMVAEKDIAWHAGNWDYNQHSIGIEHAGFADTNYFTDAEYRASAKLVAFLMRRYNMTLVRPSGIAPVNPGDGSGVIGHDQVPDPRDPQLGGGAGHHYDPGRHWNWTYYMSLVNEYYDETQEFPPKTDRGLLDPLLSLPPILVAALIFVLLILVGVIAFSIRAVLRAGHPLGKDTTSTRSQLDPRLKAECACRSADWPPQTVVPWSQTGLFR
jgi:N-acetyl-anhydromuramyl-L-alanine amidase AmpD